MRLLPRRPDRRHYMAIGAGKHTARGMVCVWCSCGVNMAFPRAQADRALDLYNTHRETYGRTEAVA